MKWLFSGFLLLLLSGCATTPQKITPPLAGRPTFTSEEERIDYVALQRSLGLERDSEDLGYSEKAFNTCEAGYGYSRAKGCHKKVFVVLHFRLMCRDTEGTISTILTDDDVAPIAEKTVQWNLKGMKGDLTTDNRGYGQIRTVSSVSQQKERVRLMVGSEFLYMRSHEITKVITPRPWCYP